MMSLCGMKRRDIELATGIKKRTIQRCISLWKSTGQVVQHSLAQENISRVDVVMGNTSSEKCGVLPLATLELRWA